MTPQIALRDPRSALPVAAALLAPAVGVAAGISPVVVISGALGAVFVALVLSDVTVGFLCFGLLSYFEVLPGVSGNVSAAKIAGTVVVLSWLATIAVRREIRHSFFSAHAALATTGIVFVAWCLVSMSWAKSSSAALTAISSWVLSLLLLPIVFTAIRKREHVRWLLITLIVGAALAALYGMTFGHASAVEEGTRLSGAGEDPNYFASILVSGVILALALGFLRSIHPGVRTLAVAVAILLLVALIDTVSRGGMVGLAVALLAAIALAGPRRRAPLAVVVLLVSLTIAGYYLTVASPAALSRITSINSSSGRTDIWTVGWRMVQAHPLTGVGVGNFPNSTVDYLFQKGALTHTAYIVDTPLVAHNVYLEVLATLGVVGLVLFLAILVMLLSCALKAARLFALRGDHVMEILCRANMVGILGILGTDFFISDEFNKVLWIQLALCPSLLAIVRWRQLVRLDEPVEAVPEPQFDPLRFRRPQLEG
jgi:putative inorganic carbon (HCO3(-)) transporter